jgi:hypothetical protein
MKPSATWLVSVSPFEAPRSLLRPGLGLAQVEMAEKLLIDWGCHVRPPAPSDGDYEDFWEQAARLSAALQAFGSRCWITTDDETAVHSRTGQRIPVVELERDQPGLRRYGAQRNLQHGHCRLEVLQQEQLAGDYMSYQTFARRAGRQVAVCTAGSGDDTDLRSVLTRMADEADRLIVKARPAKYGIYTLDLPPAVTGPARLKALDKAIADSDLGWAMVHLEGRPEQFLAQTWVDMGYEYRLFVVGQQLVTGAGCIEQHTPLDNTAAFDPKVEPIRNGPDRVWERADIVAGAVAFGQTVVSELADEVPELQDYVLDVALAPTGDYLIIELNGLLNSGLYASDPRLVTGALAAQ